MKKLVLALCTIMLVTATLSSCKKVVTALFPGMDARVPDVQLTIPPILFAPPSEVSIGSFTANFNLDSIIRANTGGVFNINDINSVKVKEITVALQNADNLNNLSNFEYARLSISSNTNTTPVTVTTVNFPDQSASTITVNPANSPELRSYVSGSQITYNVDGKVRRPTTKALTMVVSVTVRVE